MSFREMSPATRFGLDAYEKAIEQGLSEKRARKACEEAFRWYQEQDAIREAQLEAFVEPTPEEEFLMSRVEDSEQIRDYARQRWIACPCGPNERRLVRAEAQYRWCYGQWRKDGYAVH